MEFLFFYQYLNINIKKSTLPNSLKLPIVDYFYLESKDVMFLARNITKRLKLLKNEKKRIQMIGLNLHAPVHLY